jgi:hypothetical protein
MKDNRKFIEILKGELEDAQIMININIAGKQKNLAERVDKLVNIFRQIAVNPQVLEIPQMAKMFNQILEASGLSPIDFSMMKAPKQEQQQIMPGGTPPEPNN